MEKISTKQKPGPNLCKVLSEFSAGIVVRRVKKKVHG